jgi:Zn-dependent membrane protease YugP
MYFDPLYFVFAIPGLLMVMWAQWRVKSTFAKYAQVRNMHGLSGLDVARQLMNNEQLQFLKVNQVPGELTDFYNPADKSINLSQSSMQASVASMAVVAHELGHAVQDKVGYVPMKVRGSIVGIASIGSSLGYMLVFLGLIFGASRGSSIGYGMAVIGLILFSAAVFFTLITLPVEFNASRRAKEMLQRNGMVSAQDQAAVNAVLSAAAWTYVAAAAGALLQFLYLALRVFGGNRR